MVQRLSWFIAITKNFINVTNLLNFNGPEEYRSIIFRQNWFIVLTKYSIFFRMIKVSNEVFKQRYYCFCPIGVPDKHWFLLNFPTYFYEQTYSIIRWISLNSFWRSYLWPKQKFSEECSEKWCFFDLFDGKDFGRYITFVFQHDFCRITILKSVFM